jgi:hypothetical protein
MFFIKKENYMRTMFVVPILVIVAFGRGLYGAEQIDMSKYTALTLKAGYELTNSIHGEQSYSISSYSYATGTTTTNTKMHTDYNSNRQCNFAMELEFFPMNSVSDASIRKIFSFGFGFSFQERKRIRCAYDFSKNTAIQSYSGDCPTMIQTTPAYLFFRFYKPAEGTSPYLTFLVGTNDSPHQRINLDGGLFIGFNLGLVTEDNLVFEIQYEWYKFSGKLDLSPTSYYSYQNHIDYKLTYSRVLLCAGFKFGPSDPVAK